MSKLSMAESVNLLGAAGKPGSDGFTSSYMRFGPFASRDSA